MQRSSPLFSTTTSLNIRNTLFNPIMQGILSLIVVVAIIASVEAFAPFTSRVVLRTALKAATDGMSSWSNQYFVITWRNSKSTVLALISNYIFAYRNPYHCQDGKSAESQDRFSYDGVQESTHRGEGRFRQSWGNPSCQIRKQSYQSWIAHCRWR